MWVDLLIVLIAVFPLFTRNEMRLTNPDASPSVIADQPFIQPQVRP
jgi:hypothetical protein